MASIEFRNVTKKYGNSDKAVIDNINFEVRENEFLVLVGPSGCGKTTTLRMIAGLESISDGELYIGGKVVNDLPPKSRNVSMVFSELCTISTLRCIWKPCVRPENAEAQ